MKTLIKSALLLLLAGVSTLANASDFDTSFSMRLDSGREIPLDFVAAKYIADGHYAILLFRGTRAQQCKPNEKVFLIADVERQVLLANGCWYDVPGVVHLTVVNRAPNLQEVGIDRIADNLEIHNGPMYTSLLCNLEELRCVNEPK